MAMGGIDGAEAVHESNSARILVIDDQAANVRLLEDILGEAGYRAVFSITDARTVERLLPAMAPDLILLDLHMPHLDGRAILSQLNATRKRDGYLPVFVLTADDDPSARRTALKLGADDCMTRPFDADELVIRCRNLLATRRIHHQAAASDELTAGELVANAGGLRDEPMGLAVVLRSLKERRHGATLEENAAALMSELSRTAEFDAVALIAIDPDGGATPIAIGGIPAFNAAIGLPLPPSIAYPLRERWSGSAWFAPVETRDGDAVDASLVSNGGLRSVCYVPITAQGRVVGLLAGASSCEPTEEKFSARLPLAMDFGAIARALLGADLAKRAEDAGVREHLLEVVRRRAFLPVFQPVVDITTRGVIGFEALTRFEDHARPDLRFAEAERVGVGLRMEEETLSAALSASESLPPSAWLSVNTSPGLLLANGHLARVLAGVQRLVVVEITEHVAIDDYAAIRGSLRSLGSNVRLAIDDAGAGFASLRHVIELEPDFIKLDADLVRGIDRDPSRQALVVGMGHFAHQTGCTLIAEGIETEPECAALDSLGVRYGQGYLLGRPAPISQPAMSGPAS